MKNTEKEYWKIKKKWVKHSLVFILIILVLISIILPMYCNYTDRAHISNVLQQLHVAKQSIENIIISNPKDSDIDINLEETDLIPLNILEGKISQDGDPIKLEHRDISSKGVISIIFSGLNVYLRLTPVLRNNKIEWECYGRPSKRMPPDCR